MLACAEMYRVTIARVIVGTFRHRHTCRDCDGVCDQRVRSCLAYADSRRKMAA